MIPTLARTARARACLERVERHDARRQPSVTALVAAAGCAVRYWSGDAGHDALGPGMPTSDALLKSV